MVVGPPEEPLPQHHNTTIPQHKPLPIFWSSSYNREGAQLAILKSRRQLCPFSVSFSFSTLGSPTLVSRALCRRRNHPRSTENYNQQRRSGTFHSVLIDIPSYRHRIVLDDKYSKDWWFRRFAAPPENLSTNDINTNKTQVKHPRERRPYEGPQFASDHTRHRPTQRPLGWSTRLLPTGKAVSGARTVEPLCYSTARRHYTVR